MDRTLILSSADREHISDMQRYYSALSSIIAAFHSSGRSTGLMDGFNDLSWATELISSMEFKESWWERMLAKIVTWRLDHDPVRLMNLCIMDDIIWLLSEEIAYRDEYNCQCIKLHDYSDKGANARMVIADEAANRIEAVKTDYIHQIHAGNVCVDSIRFLRYDVAIAPNTRANIAVKARARSQATCPRRETSDVLAVGRIISDVRSEYDRKLQNLISPKSKC